MFPRSPAWLSTLLFSSFVIENKMVVGEEETMEASD